jgi:hypothetical protein
MFQELLGRDDYNKDIASLGHAERFTDFLIAHPDKISGSFLVMILSTSDDFAVGLQSTQTEILRHNDEAKNLAASRKCGGSSLRSE